MKLTEEQIQELYKFTRAHFVYHFDLQTELVDHLAYGIEAQWIKNPNSNFQEALNKEFKKFGIFGFQDVITERQKTLSKRYWKIILHFYQEYFTLPKLAMSLLLVVALFSILDYYPTFYQRYILIGIFVVFLIRSTIKLTKYTRKLKKKERKWMLEEMLMTQMGFFNFLIIPIHIFNIQFEIQNPYILALISVLSVSLLLLLYVIIYVIPPKAEELLEETYPEYKMMQTL
jgi:hypothetical protein